MTWPWQLSEKGVRLRIHLQPRASQNRVIGLHGDALKIALTAPPVGGAANAALLRFLAKLFALPASSVVLLSGEKSREKCVLLCTPTPERAIHTLRDVLQRVDKETFND
jgi:uncharacterized protein (TIGR00251 family)